MSTLQLTSLFVGTVVLLGIAYAVFLVFASRRSSQGESPVSATRVGVLPPPRQFDVGKKYFEDEYFVEQDVDTNVAQPRLDSSHAPVEFAGFFEDDGAAVGRLLSPEQKALLKQNLEVQLSETTIRVRGACRVVPDQLSSLEGFILEGPAAHLLASESLSALIAVGERLEEQSPVGDHPAGRWPERALTDMDGSPLGYLIEHLPKEYIHSWRRKNFARTLSLVINPPMINGRLLNTKLTAEERLQILRELAILTNRYHEIGVVVGDLSPGNIAFKRDPIAVMILDFAKSRVEGNRPWVALNSDYESSNEDLYQPVTMNDDRGEFADFVRALMVPVIRAEAAETQSDVQHYPGLGPAQLNRIRQLWVRAERSPLARPTMQEWVAAFTESVSSPQPPQG